MYAATTSASVTNIATTLSQIDMSKVKWTQTSENATLNPSICNAVKQNHNITCDVTIIHRVGIIPNVKTIMPNNLRSFVLKNSSSTCITLADSPIFDDTVSALGGRVSYAEQVVFFDWASATCSTPVIAYQSISNYGINWPFSWIVTPQRDNYSVGVTAGAREVAEAQACYLFSCSSYPIMQQRTEDQWGNTYYNSVD